MWYSSILFQFKWQPLIIKILFFSGLLWLSSSILFFASFLDILSGKPLALLMWETLGNYWILTATPSLEFALPVTLSPMCHCALPYWYSSTSYLFWEASWPYIKTDLEELLIIWEVRSQLKLYNFHWVSKLIPKWKRYTCWLYF